MVSKTWDAAIVKDKDALQAVWPFTLEQKAGVTITRNPLLTPYLGPYFFLPDDITQLKRLNKEERIYKAFWQQLPESRFFEMHCLPGYNNFLPLQQQGFSHTQKITYRIDLQQSEQEVSDNMKSSVRRHIRTAEEELIVKDGMPYLSQFYGLHKETLLRKDEPYPYTRQFFDTVIQTTVERNAGILLSAHDQRNEVSAMLFTAYDNETMYLLLSAMNTHAAHNGAISLLIWEAIKKAKALGLKTFDFEGSIDPGIELFFRSFGGTRIPYLVFQRNHSLLMKLKKWVRK